jgi:uncharacterized phiE125 gp8 family phage protein
VKKVHAQTPRLVTPPATLPVTLAEAKAHLRVDHNDEDSLITSLIRAVTSHMDGYGGVLGRAIVTQAWEQAWSGFPFDRHSRYQRVLRLPLGPVLTKAAVTIQYRSPGSPDALQTLDPALYHLVSPPGWPAVELDDLSVWPNTADRPDAVVVRVTCGYGAAADVPDAIKVAALLMIGGFYLNREDVSPGRFAENPAFIALLKPFRTVGP